MKKAEVGVQIEGLAETECSCNKCKSMCLKVPCFPTPEEVVRLENMGFGDKLYIERYVEQSTGELLMAVIPKTRISMTRYGIHDSCVFLDRQGLCELHDLNLKPSEGRLAHHAAPQGKGYKLKIAIMKTWQTELGKEVLSRYLTPEEQQKQETMQAEVDVLFADGTLAQRFKELYPDIEL